MFCTICNKKRVRFSKFFCASCLNKTPEHIDITKKLWKEGKFDFMRLPRGEKYPIIDGLSSSQSRLVFLREKVFNKFNNQCNKCKFPDKRAFQIDHVNGGGKGERVKMGIGFYSKVLKDTENKYQLLCANCNWIKRFENKEVKYIL